VRDLTRACVHCGLCLESCPTYRVLHEEADSPRGRILLVDALLEGRVREREARVHLDRCVGCLACETACPSGVPYGHLLEEARRRLGAPRIARLVLNRIVTRPLAVRALTLVARTLGLVPPAGRALPWPAPPPRPKARVALHLGCVTPHLFPRLPAEAAHALTRLGYLVEVPREQACCGALHRHAGLDAGALLERNARAFAGYDLAVSLAAGCSTTPGLTDICRVLLAERPFAGARLPPVRVAFDAPCHLQHAQGVDAAPLLDAIEGVERVTLPGASECCGAGGLYMGLQPSLARRVRAGKIAEILASQATVVATPNPGCMAWIWRGLRAMGAAIEVVHPATLLARALGRDSGGPRPGAPGS
jgi:glycolate oxidase iron-sulfur subunit